MGGYLTDGVENSIRSWYLTVRLMWVVILCYGPKQAGSLAF